jgi:hypothetical protein
MSFLLNLSVSVSLLLSPLRMVFLSVVDVEILGFFPLALFKCHVFWETRMVNFGCQLDWIEGCLENW